MSSIRAALFLLIAPATAEAAPVTCRPALPVFCANVHVGCSGRTTRATAGFEVGAGEIRFETGEVWRVEASTSSSGTVYRRGGSKDWIRIDPDGRFSQRLYGAQGVLMAYGECAAPAIPPSSG